MGTRTSNGQVTWCCISGKAYGGLRPYDTPVLLRRKHSARCRRYDRTSEREIWESTDAWKGRTSLLFFARSRCAFNGQYLIQYLPFPPEMASRRTHRESIAPDASLRILTPQPRGHLGDHMRVTLRTCTSGKPSCGLRVRGNARYILALAP